MTDAELLEEERKKKEAAAMGEVQPQAPVMDMSQENPDFGAMLRSSGIPDSNVVSQVPGIENVQNPGVFDPEKIEPVEPVGTPTTVGESIRQTYNESVLADLINKGFGQEAFQSKSLDGTPTYSIYNKRFGTLGSQVPYSEASPEAKAQAMKFMLSTGGQERPLPATPTSPVLNAEQVQGVLNEQRAATEASASDATPSVTPTIESPSGGAQGQAGAVQSPFLQSPDTPSGLGGPLLRGFNMVNDASRLPNAPMGQEATQAALGGRTLNEYLNAPAGTESVSGLRTDPQGRMIPSGFETRAEAFPDYEDQAAAREARLAARPDFGTAVSDREKRGSGEMSMADAVDLAGGNRKEARAMIIRQRQGLDPMTGKPTEAKDTKTPEQIESDRLAIEAQELQNERSRQIIAKGKEPDATAAEKKAADRAQAVQDGTITQAQADDANKRDLLGSPPAGYDTWAEYEAITGVDQDGDGKVATQEEAEDAAPSEAKDKKLPTVTDEASYNSLKSGQKYIYNGKEYTKK